MFIESVELDGSAVPRFARCEDQTQVLEVAILDVKPELQIDFEQAFDKAQQIISSMPGYMSHELKGCLEKASRYILLVSWETLEAHTEGFRGSEQYQQWRALLHHFYEPFPVVEHYR